MSILDCIDDSNEDELYTCQNYIDSDSTIYDDEYIYDDGYVYDDTFLYPKCHWNIVKTSKTLYITPNEAELILPDRSNSVETLRSMLKYKYNNEVKNRLILAEKQQSYLIPLTNTYSYNLSHNKYNSYNKDICEQVNDMNIFETIKYADKYLDTY